MFTTGEFERLQDELNQRLSEKGRKLSKIWFTILLIVILACGVLVLIFPRQFSSEETVWIMPVYGGLSFLTALVGYLISIKYRSEKPYFEYLFDEIVSKVNLSEGLFLDYQSYIKEKQVFNTTGGLFTRYASIKVRRRIKGLSSKENNFEVFDCTMTTSNGKSQTVHFDGVYFVLHKQLNTSLQVRSNGAPRLKGVKFHKMEEFEDIRVYKPLEKNLRNIDYMLVKYFQKLSDVENHKKVYISVVDGEVHLAINYRKHPLRKPKDFDLTILNRMTSDFLTELNEVNSLDDIEDYDY